MTLLQFAAIVSDHRVSNDFAMSTKLEMLNSAPNRPFPKIANHFTFVPRRMDATATTTATRPAATTTAAARTTKEVAEEEKE
jgi:hypothetical protein